MASSKGDFASLDEGTKTPATSSTEASDVVKTKGAEGSVKKGAKGGDGKSSIPGAVFNLANAVRI